MLGTALLVLLFSLPVVAAGSQVEGDLVFSGEVRFSGDYVAQGPGEMQIFPGPGLGVTGDGQRIVVEEFTKVSHIVDSPVGPVRYGDGPAEREEHVFDQADLMLEAFGPAFQSVLWRNKTEGSLLHVTAADVADAPLAAYRDPGLLLEEIVEGGPQTNADDDRTFTLVADGDRFPVPVQRATAEGDHSIYFWDAEFKVVEPDGQTTHFVSGDRREQVVPGYDRLEETYYKVHLVDGEVFVTGSHWAWLDRPVLHLDGTVLSENADGTLVVDGDRHRLDGIQVMATGRIELRPVAVGEPVEVSGSWLSASPHGQYASTSSGFEKSAVSMSGSDVAVDFAGRSVDDGSSAVQAAAATAGALAVIGAVWALTPQGKWVLLGALSPLYAKTRRNRLLESPQRERLLQAIQANPGLHISGLRQVTEMGWGATVYHLRLMEKRELITSIPRSGQRHFFVKTPGVDAARVRNAMAAIVGQQTAQRVASVVLADPGVCQKEITERLGVSKRVVAHHVARLYKAELLEKERDGGRVRCYPKPELVEAMTVLEAGVSTTAATVSPKEPAVAVSA